LIFLTYAVLLSAGFFVNNIFYFELGQMFSSAEELAGFLGLFMAVFSLMSLVTRSFFSGRMLLRLGLLGGLLSTPIVVLLGASFVIGLGWWGAVGTWVFWSVITMRLYERLSLGTLGQPAYYTLYQPLSRELRGRVQTTAETISGPLAGGLTGLVLLFLNKVMGLNSVGLSVALLPLLATWIVVAVAASREFRTALTFALKRRGISGSDLTVSGPASLRILERGLESSHPTEVLYCLRLLEEAEHPRFSSLVFSLINHSSAEVRRGICPFMERQVDSASLPLLVARLDREEDAEVRGGLLRATGAAGGPEARSVIEPRLLDPDPAVRCGALVAMLRYCGARAGDQAARDLGELVRSRDVEQRIFAARVLAELDIRERSQPLTALLADTKMEVRRAAVQAVQGMDDQGIWRLVIANLEVPAVRAEALRALLRAGPDTFAALESAYQAGTSSRALRKLILQIFGRSATEKAVEFLTGELRVEDRGLLSEVLWSLHLCRYQASRDEANLVEECLCQEVEHGSGVLAAWRDLESEPDAELLSSALGQELEQVRKRIFLLLSFLYEIDTVMKIWSNFSGPASLRDLALELFEAKIDKHHQTMTMSLLAGESSEPPADPSERLRQILIDKAFWTSTWTYACAVEAAGKNDNVLSAMQRKELLSHEDDLVRETAERRHGRRKLTGGRTIAIVERVKTLKGVSIFREIDDEVLAGLAHRLEEVRVEPDEVVFREEDFGRSMYIVSSGRLRLHAGDETISELRAGQIFGELSALEAEARVESATAIDRSLLFRLSDTDLHAFMETRIEVVRGIIAYLCHRVRWAATHKLADQEEPGRKVPGAASMSASRYRVDSLSSLEKVLILKTAQIFSEVGDDILAEVAARTEEVRLRKNEVLFNQGDPGTTTYIVAAGHLRIHVGDQWIAEATERAAVGELAALSSEPRTASVTATEDTLLLALDQGSLFELIWDQHEIARGIIRVLVMRLRRLRRGVTPDGLKPPAEAFDKAADKVVTPV
jgi:CRP-like cAMP-binding protein/HEAT repeat protein